MQFPLIQLASMISISAFKYDMTNSSNSIPAFKHLFFIFYFFSVYVLILINDEVILFF